MISACLWIQDQLPIILKCKHIYGHQDDEMEYHQLSQEAQKNVDMDLLAKELVESLERTEEVVPERCDHPDSLAQCSWKTEEATQCYNTSNLYNETDQIAVTNTNIF